MKSSINKIILSIALMLFLSSESIAVDDGHSLLRECKDAENYLNTGKFKNENGYTVGKCLGLLQGVKVAMQLVRDDLSSNKYKSCPPESSFSNATALKIVLKHLRDHPAVVNSGTDAIKVMQAFKYAYPCK